MPTTFTSLRVKGATYVGGALTIVGAIAAAAITATTVTGTVGSFTTSLSGTTLSVGTGIVLRDSDGAGCSAIHVKNGVVTAQVHTCL